jgi:hypothetical protein
LRIPTDMEENLKQQLEALPQVSKFIEDPSCFLLLLAYHKEVGTHVIKDRRNVHEPSLLFVLCGLLLHLH